LNKDNLLFAVFGILIGFVSGFLLKEAMDIRQPARILPGQAAIQGAAGPAPASGPGGQSGGPASAEVQELVAHLQQNPNDADAIRRLADLNFEIGSWKRAADLYTRYLALRGDDPDVLSDLAVCYRESKDIDRALQTLRRAQGVAPDHWQSVYNEAIILVFDLQQLDAATQVMDKLKKMQPDNQRVAELAAEIERQKNAA
jgi:tetratricopeptide (TPR) repeat protein